MLARGLWLKTPKLITRFIHNLQKCCLLTDFQYYFSLSRSAADLLTVVFDRFDRACNRSEATLAVALNILLWGFFLGFATLLFYVKSSLTELKVRHWILFRHYSFVEGFKLFWMKKILRKYPAVTGASF